MKIIFTVLAACFCLCTSGASAAENTYKGGVGGLYVPDPENIAGIQRYDNREIEYMVQNYSAPELAREAIRINNAQRQAALRSGATPPAKLTREILQSKEKTAEWLRSQYKFSY